MMKGGGNSMMNFGFLPFGGFGWIFMILWWVLIIVGVVALIKWITEHSRGGFRDHEKSALEILKERYAKGEIGKKSLKKEERFALVILLTRIGIKNGGGIMTKYENSPY